MQGDLFQIPTVSSTASFNVNKSSFLETYRIILRLDQLVMMLILMLVIFAVVFSVGVEKGKHSVSAGFAAKKQAAEINTEPHAYTRAEMLESPKVPATTPAIQEEAAAASRTSLTEPQSGNIVVTEVPVKEEAPAVKKPAGKYTIQLVTYKSDSEAQKQIEKLENKGYEGFVIPSGNYYQVCVNAFQSKQSALSQLQMLQVQKLAPHDAYVRSMPH